MRHVARVSAYSSFHFEHMAMFSPNIRRFAKPTLASKSTVFAHHIHFNEICAIVIGWRVPNGHAAQIVFLHSHQGSLKTLARRICPGSLERARSDLCNGVAFERNVAEILITHRGHVSMVFIHQFIHVLHMG
jgi:hypothetical protein